MWLAGSRAVDIQLACGDGIMENLIAIISKVAPTLATLMAGPIGGAVTQLIASTLGVANDPSVITAALSADPEVAKQQLAYLEAQAQSETARWNGQSENATAIKEAYLAELQRGGFWSWLRPAAGWVTVAQSIAFTVVLMRALWAGQLDILGYVPQMVFFMAPLSAIMGVYFWQRGAEKQAVFNTGGVIANVAELIRNATQKKK
jgi:hypothetical protein